MQQVLRLRTPHNFLYFFCCLFVSLFLSSCYSFSPSFVFISSSFCCFSHVSLIYFFMPSSPFISCFSTFPFSFVPSHFSLRLSSLCHFVSFFCASDLSTGLFVFEHRGFSWFCLPLPAADGQVDCQTSQATSEVGYIECSCTSETIKWSTGLARSLWFAFLICIWSGCRWVRKTCPSSSHRSSPPTYHPALIFHVTALLCDWFGV